MKYSGCLAAIAVSTLIVFKVSPKTVNNVTLNDSIDKPSYSQGEQVNVYMSVINGTEKDLNGAIVTENVGAYKS